MTVDSEQRIFLREPVVPASNAGARRLGAAYWDEVSAFSRGLVRPRVTADEVALVVVGIGPLLRFGPAETTVDDDLVECRFAIRGGLLAAKPGGWLVLAQRGPEPLELSIAVVGFHPRLRRRGGSARLRPALYDALQAPLHADVSRRFLERAVGGRL